MGQSSPQAPRNCSLPRKPLLLPVLQESSTLTSRAQTLTNTLQFDPEATSEGWFRISAETMGWGSWKPCGKLIRKVPCNGLSPPLRGLRAPPPIPSRGEEGKAGFHGQATTSTSAVLLEEGTLGGTEGAEPSAARFMGCPIFRLC